MKGRKKDKGERRRKEGRRGGRMRKGREESKKGDNKRLQERIERGSEKEGSGKENRYQLLFQVLPSL